MADLLAGLAFWLHTKNTRIPPHLYFVISLPDDLDDDHEEVVVVNISTYRQGSQGADTSCILSSQDHPSINHDSFVFYAHALRVPLLRLNHWIDNGMAKVINRASDDVVKKIIEGAKISEGLPFEIRDILEERGDFD